MDDGKGLSCKKMISYLTEPIVNGLKNDSAYLSNDNHYDLLVGQQD